MKYRIVLILLFSYMFSNAQIERVEPPFWWSGMKMNELQLMFYGKDIADYNVSVEKGVTINDITKTENPNYVFVTLDTRDVK
ncbi:MAG: cyclomaltodextrinase N-terminal domain-containing protein, partial [Gillisia sp.]